MIKDNDYYRTLDLAAIPDATRNAPSVRATDDAWSDVLTAIHIRCTTERITKDDLARYAGMPDVIREHNGGESWEYHWIGNHGPDKYTSFTPFLIRDGVVAGLTPREDEPLS